MCVCWDGMTLCVPRLHGVEWEDEWKSRKDLEANCRRTIEALSWNFTSVLKKITGNLEVIVTRAEIVTEYLPSANTKY